MKIAPAEEVRLFIIFFSQTAQRGKGEGAEGVPSLVKGDAVGSGARPDAKVAFRSKPKRAGYQYQLF